MLLLTCFSKILDGNGVLDIGLKLFSKVMLPFLGSGVTLAILKHCGIWPFFKEFIALARTIYASHLAETPKGLDSPRSLSHCRGNISLSPALGYIDEQLCLESVSRCLSNFSLGGLKVEKCS